MCSSAGFPLPFPGARTRARTHARRVMDIHQTPVGLAYLLYRKPATLRCTRRLHTHDLINHPGHPITAHLCLVSPAPFPGKPIKPKGPTHWRLIYLYVLWLTPSWHAFVCGVLRRNGVMLWNVVSVGLADEIEFEIWTRSNINVVDPVPFDIGTIEGWLAFRKIFTHRDSWWIILMILFHHNVDILTKIKAQ